MKCILSPVGRVRSRRGFSLVELLVVVAITVALASLSLPALSSLRESGRLTHAVTELSGLLEQARQYAIAQNTYVWVAFYPTTDSSTGLAELSVVALASKDGTDPSPWSTYDMSANTDIVQISKVRTFRQVRLGEAGAYTAANFESLPSSPVVGSPNSLSSRAVFAIKVPAYTSSKDFNRVVQFTPSGEARNGASPIDLIEFALQPQRGSSGVEDHNAAVLRVNGMTGQTLVYRR